MQTNSLQPNTKRTSTKRVGRGGTRGKTSGRGHKGQKQHGGHGIRPHMRDVIKKIPKLRGHGKNRARTHVPHTYRSKAMVINVARIEELFAAGETVSPSTLAQKGIISERQAATRDVKVLGQGDIKKKVTVSGCQVSETAKVKIEKAGGTVA